MCPTPGVFFLFPIIKEVQSDSLGCQEPIEAVSQKVGFTHATALFGLLNQCCFDKRNQVVIKYDSEIFSIQILLFP
jgi:hypothetical protein